MNDEKVILLISTILAIIGMLSIYLLSLFYKPIEIPISDLTLEYEGRKVRVKGEITRVYLNKEGTFGYLVLSDNISFVQVPLFSDLISALKKEGISPRYFKKGMIVEVSGIVSEYKGLLQVIPRKVDDIRLIT